MRMLAPFLVLMLVTGCVREPVHQGNRIKPEEAWLIQKGDTRFRVEQALGTPVLKDTLHPNRATYIEQFEDKDTGRIKTRGIEITYDEALRVKRIRRFGLDD